MPEMPPTKPAIPPARRRLYLGFTVGLLVWMVWCVLHRFPAVWLALGIGQASQPFVDLYGLLASSDAYWAGLNPFVPFDWDPYRRPFLYGEWWFGLGWLGLGRKDNVWLGFLLAALVLVTSLLMARPRSAREWCYLFLLLVSPAWLLSFERANNDPVVLVLVSLGLWCFRSERWPQRALAVLLFSSCVALKYYPLVTLVVLLDSRSRQELGRWVLFYFAILVVAWPHLEIGFKTAAHYTPGPSWLHAFGAPVLLRNFDLEIRLAWMLPAAAMILWGLGWTWRSGRATPAAPTGATPDDEREFLCGGSMLVGLFFLGASYSYKLIFAVWMLPWLWRAATAPGWGRHWARLALGLLLGVACLDGWGAVGINVGLARWSMPAALATLKVVLTTTQLLTWALVLCLLRLLPALAGPRIARLLASAAR
jgi:hypothetical protein